MRKILCTIAFVPAVLGAQAGKSPCPGAVGLDSALQGYVSKPDRKPRRRQDGIVPILKDPTYSTAVPQQEGRDFGVGNMTKIVVLVGVVDTTGKLIPTSLAVTQSPNADFTDAVCAAGPQMAFDPALRGGQKVAAVYTERFIFYRNHMGINTPIRSETPPR
jgi:hypothetical protein